MVIQYVSYNILKNRKINDRSNYFETKILINIQLWEFIQKLVRPIDIIFIAVETLDNSEKFKFWDDECQNIWHRQLVIVKDLDALRFHLFMFIVYLYRFLGVFMSL